MRCISFLYIMVRFNPNVNILAEALEYYIFINIIFLLMPCVQYYIPI